MLGQPVHAKIILIPLLLFSFLQACGGGGSGGGNGGNNNGGGNGNTGEPPVINLTDTAIAESNSGTVELQFNISLDRAIAGDISVDYTSTDQSAVAGEDFVESSGTLVIPGGDTAATISVLANGDLCYESDETFQLTLSNPSANAILGNATAIGTIENDDQKPELTLADAELDEGDSGTSEMTFTVGLDRASCFNVEGSYTTNTVTANGEDFVVEGGDFTIQAGAQQAAIAVEIKGDTTYETDETLTLNLENISPHINIVDGEAFGTIRTDDLPPLVVLPAEIPEGDDTNPAMIFTLQLAGPTNEITVDYETADLTATIDDNDYVAASGSVTIPAGIVTATVEVEIIGDAKEELHEDFLLNLSNLVGDAVLNPASNSALGRIRDDDTVFTLNPEIYVPPGYGSEGDDAGVITDMFFNVVLNTPVASDVVLNYSTSATTATEGVDYNAASGTVTIPAGETEVLITVGVLGDIEIEGPEYFVLHLSNSSPNVADLITPDVTGTILDDDYVGPPFLSAQRVEIFEGDSGSRELTVHVTLGSPATNAVGIDYATRDVTALAGSDYVSVSGSLSFEIGETVKSFVVPVNGDTVIEADEMFEVVLSNLTGNAILFEEVSEAWIQTDDPFAMVSIADVALFEGDSGTSEMVFTVSIDSATADPVTFDYASADASAGNSATEGEDYTAVSGSVTIPAGELEATIAVDINGDTDNEFDETLVITLSNISQNAEFADDSADGKIVNDDESPGWSAPQAFESDRHDNILPQITMNSTGDATVLWAPNNFGPYTSRRYAGGSWSAFETPPESSVSGTMREDRGLFIDGDGNTTLGWIPSGTSAARHNEVSGWSLEYEFDPTGYQTDFVELAGNDAGSVIAIWKLNVLGSSSTDHLMFSVYDPALDQWSNQDYIVFEGSFIFQPDIAMNDSGTAVAVWRETSIRASFYDPISGSWSAPEIITNELTPGFNAPGYVPQVAIDNNGNAIAVWDDGLSLGTSVTGSVWASRYDVATGQWGEAFVIEQGTLDATNAQIEMDAAGNAFVVWLQDNDNTDGFNDSFEIRARRYDATTDLWEPEVSVQNTDTRVNQFGINLERPLDVPALAVDTAGNALLVWSEEINGDFVIRVSHYDISKDTPTWSPPEQISDDTYGFAMYPDIAIDESGNALVVWQMGDSEFFTGTDVSEIGWTSYTAP